MWFRYDGNSPRNNYEDRCAEAHSDLIGRGYERNEFGKYEDPDDETRTRYYIGADGTVNAEM